LLRLLIPLDDKICLSFTTDIRKQTSATSNRLTGPSNRYKRRAVCTKSRDVFSAR